MKRLIRIGSGVFVNSIIPILIWVVLPLILHDDKISNTFSITYSIAFLFMVFKSIFASGANIKKEKEGDKNAVLNGMFWGIVISVAFSLFFLLKIDNFIGFFGEDVVFYRPFVIYGFLFNLLQYLISLVSEKLYFEDKEKLANKHLFAFNALSITILVIFTLLIENIMLAMLLSIVIPAIYVAALFVWQFEKFNIKFNFLSTIKYESANIFSTILMFIIYFFGLKTVVVSAPEYLAAFNFASICSDAQWDMYAAVEVAAKVDICKGRFDYKQQMKQGYLYTLFLMATSIVMAAVVLCFQSLVVWLAIVYLAFQILDMPLYASRLIQSTYIQLEHSATLNTSILLATKVLRTLLSVVILSPYCLEIAQISVGVVNFVIYFGLIYALYKVENGKLVRKNKLKQI